MIPVAAEDGDRAYLPEQREGGSRMRTWISEKGLSRDFWIFFVVSLFIDFGLSMFFFLYSLFLLDIGFRERELGLITGAMTLGGMTGTFPIGVLAKRVGLHRVIFAGFILVPLLCALRTFASGETAQIAIAFLAGMCGCYWAVCFSPTVAQITSEKNRPFAFSLLMSVGVGFSGLGGLAGGLVPGWLQRMTPSLQPVDAKRMALLLCCAAFALGALPASRLSLHMEQETKSGSRRLDPFLFRFLPAMALWSLAAGAFIPFANPYLSRYGHVPLARIGVIFSISQLMQVAGMLAAPLVFKRCGLIAGILYMQVAAAIALGGMSRAHHMPLIAILYLCFMALHWMSGPGIYSLVMNRVVASERNSASAATIFVAMLCQAIASTISGRAIGNFGYPAVLAVIAGMALLAAFLFWVLLRDRNPSDVEIVVTAEC